ncbi:hypothetical protein BDZ85DRAFT_72912 [Elsinoe ampelina]|uniref:Uncharacterized protein n=1 Tax=Elsinoe ampelina TaxID=302913 RepID=A0A6A6GK78_9PEZI|nr:hypothetical protein BDZ85DRAFT_72912 [Elsinoe ampelina]
MCERKHCVYSTIDGPGPRAALSCGWRWFCQCWEPPSPLLLVSKAFSHDALQIFYAKNRFVIKPKGDLYTTVEARQPHRSELSHFLRLVPESALWALRDIEAVFPAFEARQYTRVTPPANNDLLKLLSEKEQFLNLSGLTIRLYVPFFDTSDKIDIMAWKTHGLPKWKFPSAWEQHRQMVLAFKELHGLHKLFVHLHKPWRHRDNSRWSMHMPGGHVSTPERYDMEAELEKEVMGPNYDGNTPDRYDEPKSGWWMIFWDLPGLSG